MHIAYMRYLTCFIENNREIILRILEQGENDADFGNSVIGTTCLTASGVASSLITNSVPVCPLRPLADAVAVKRTMTSRNNWILASRVAF